MNTMKRIPFIQSYSYSDWHTNINDLFKKFLWCIRFIIIFSGLTMLAPSSRNESSLMFESRFGNSDKCFFECLRLFLLIPCKTLSGVIPSRESLLCKNGGNSSDRALPEAPWVPDPGVVLQKLSEEKSSSSLPHSLYSNSKKLRHEFYLTANRAAVPQLLCKSRLRLKCHLFRLPEERPFLTIFIASYPR